MPHANDGAEALPPIAALFLVVFDQKIGYKVSWQRSLPDIQLEGLVEYKSLPSGLHNVKQDLIYFTQDEYAGLSAFVSKAAGEADRNARFAAVGVYVPLSYGRLGRAWMHAQGLRELADSYVDKQDDRDALEKYWDTHRLATKTDEIRTAALEEPSSPIAVKPPVNKRASRALSEAAGFSVREHVLSPDHPALSMPGFLDAFGPLVFPLYRAALLKKRILFLGSAPIQRTCNFVYNLSIFSNIPVSIADTLPIDSASYRIKPLFNVGIHDIAELETKTKEGWVACTTDDILGTKRNLYDVLIEVPTNANEWPKIVTSDGKKVLATQRDLRRYNALNKELSRMDRLRAQQEQYRDEEAVESDNDDDVQPLMQSISSIVPEQQPGAPSIENESSITEPSSWASIAYSSFLWWASAGERSTAQEEETEQDASLLEDLVNTTTIPTSPLTPTNATKHRRSSSIKRRKRSTTSLSRLVTGEDSDEERDPPSLEETQQKSMVLIAYFHRSTTLLVSGLDDIVNGDDNDEQEHHDDEVIQLTAEDVSRLGLDIWSAADAQFIGDIGWAWWSKDIQWSGRNVELCGVRIC
ncbi:hypothetical protein K461DRAFT_288576 [Myriangium duriaei CBS 260.36]|uniref:DUF4484 domain-containing protein n=1 Tax=Myriangium duriaei CBS 260.36 TaxID=1168546 RepID=A0A9P4IWY4_9PEZI|nr:hypothetical protein K461DRAFT_288576 [Myriangium duriaei CBS 260.36]